MDLTYIQDHWKRKAPENQAASISAWDSVADDYVYNSSINQENNSFLHFLHDRIEFTKDMRVLDVGCGAGAYSLALASEAGQTVGLDFSPGMIASAKRTAAERGIENASFLVRDWYSCGMDDPGGQFDLVFAHTTPAVADYDGLVKMIELSSHYCALCKPARRRDLLFDKLREISGAELSNSDSAVAYSFDTIWGHGFNPDVMYTDTVFSSAKKLVDAKKWYINRLKGICTIDDTMERKLSRYLEDISVDGMVKDKTYTTLVTFFWEVNLKK